MLLVLRCTACIGHAVCSVLSAQVCGVLGQLLHSALDPNVDGASIMDVRLVVRCVGALLRKHIALAPDKCAELLQVGTWIHGVGRSVVERSGWWASV